MNTIKPLALALAVTAALLTAGPAPLIAGPLDGGSATRTVSALQTYTSGNTFVLLDGFSIPAYDCNKPGKFDAPFIDNTAPNADDAVQVALAAQLSGREVYMVWDGSCRIQMIKLQ